MKILHLAINVYNYWSTYEGEYLNEALMELPGVELRTWGKYRPFYDPGLNASEAVECLYGNDFPHVILVHSTMTKGVEQADRKILDGLERLRERCILV